MSVLVEWWYGKLESSKQSTVADSATEVEYIAASDAAKEAVGSGSSSLNWGWFLPS